MLEILTLNPESGEPTRLPGYRQQRVDTMLDMIDVGKRLLLALKRMDPGPTD